MKFQGLPTEIVLHIIKHFATQCLGQLSSSLISDCSVESIVQHERYQRALASLCRTCRHFHHLLQPLLYATLYKPQNCVIGPFKEYKVDFKLRQYLRTLLKRPDLASKVRFLDLGAWESKWSVYDQHLTFPKKPDAELKELYRQHAKQGVLFPSLINDLRDGFEDAEVALLVTLCSNINHLSITLKPFTTYPSHQHIFRPVLREAFRAGSLLPTFSSLRSVTVRCVESTSSYGIPLYVIQEPLLFPSLQEIILEDMNQSPAEMDHFTCYPSTSTASKLILRNCRLSTSAVAALVKTFVKLEILEVGFGIDRAYNHTGGPFSSQWRAVVSALRAHAKSLVSLKLYADQRAEVMRVLSESGRSGEMALSRFKHLRYLSAQQVVLFGSPTEVEDEEEVESTSRLREIIPAGLQTLVIRDCSPSSHLVWHLEGLLDMKRRGESCIEHLVLNPGKVFEENHLGLDLWPRYSLLMERFADEGVTCNMVVDRLV